MITKERLQELIELGATIYYHKLTNGDYFDILDLSHSWVAGNINDLELDRLFETKEEAEWELEFGNITRTETLSLPTWEEIEKDLKNCSDGEYVIVDDDRVTFVYYKLKKKPKLSIIANFDAIEFDATKENYIEACKLAKKLFLGEVEE